MAKKELLQILNLIGFIATVIINFLAILLPLGGNTTQQLSDDLPNLFVPQGITFSIWSIIYIFLGLFSVYQIRDIFKKDKIDMEYLDNIGYYFIIASIANVTWIFLWHYKLVPLSLIFMIVLLFSLILIYLRLKIGKSEVSKIEKVAVHVPFSIYLGWITVATIANVTAVIVDYGLNGLGWPEEAFFGLLPIILTILVIIVAVLITFAMLILRKDYVYSLVIAWSLLGIFIKQIASDLTVGITALISMLIIIIGMIYLIIKRK
ncbi:MAG: tryptophan-rich sensory protein [Promethearchaeota archaeon]|nr:MAG: tryptophan-rich sensory protein [Candidatus Lokiarchaeota archaeon]